MSLARVKRRIIKFITLLPLILFCISVVGCLYFLVVTSVKTQNEYIVNKTGIPSIITLEHYAAVLSKTLFVHWLLNSFLITSLSLIIAYFISILLSFGFSNSRFKFKNTSFSIVSALMVIPPIVLITPIYEMLAKLKIVNTYQGTISVYISWIVPFWTFFLTKFFIAINRSLIDSARIDGCTDLQLLWKIIIPLSRAPIMTLATVSTLWVWNDLLISLIFLQKDKLRTLMVGLTVFKGMYTTNIPATFAGLLIATIPMVIFYIFGQRFFMKGIMSGAVKG